MTHKEIASLFVLAELSAYGQCKTKTLIQLKQWVDGSHVKGDFFTTEQLKGLKYCALYIECYNAMVKECKPDSSNG